MFWNTVFFLSSKHKRFRCFPEKTRVRLWFPGAWRGWTRSACKWNCSQFSHSIAVGVILLCHPHFPSCCPGSSVMAKWINSLPAFQRWGIDPHYLYLFPSLWTPVSKVLCPSHYQAHPCWSFLSGWGHWWCFYNCCYVSEPSEGACWCSAFVHCHLIPVVALAQDVPEFSDWCAVHSNASWEAADWKEAVAPSVKISWGHSFACSPVKWGLRWWHISALLFPASLTGFLSIHCVGGSWANASTDTPAWSLLQGQVLGDSLLFSNSHTFLSGKEH